MVTYSALILVSGLVMLVFAGDYLVRGAAGLAENLGISPLVIGLTVVAFGTSAPELLISLQAALSGAPGIAIGNVVGSNISNVLLVVGVPALIAPVLATEPGLRRNMTAMLAVTMVFMLMVSSGSLSRAEGATLLLILATVIAWQIHTARAMKLAAIDDYHDEIGETPHNPIRIGLYLVGGVVGLPIGAHLTVTGASAIAESFGISQTVIGLTIVAIGTSLPELATTVMAAYRGSSAVAMGNVVGSNLFNLAGIMGVTAMIVPVQIPDRIITIDMWVMAATSLLVAIFAYARLSVGKAFGVSMLVAYAAYLISLF